MYLENKTEIFYSKNIEIQFRKMYTHFKKGMVKNMKNWKKIMAGLCAAAMVSSMVVPVWAAEETTEEAADDGDVADVSEAMLGLWKDSAGDIYGFYKDNSFFGQWKDEEQDVLGVYALSSDGEYTALVMQFANDDGTYDDENMVTYLVQANEEYNKAGKTPVSWNFTTMPSENWKNNVGSALLEYAQGTGKWDAVETAFVDGWATEYQLANGQ